MATLDIGVRHSTEIARVCSVASMALFRSGPGTWDLRGFLQVLEQRTVEADHGTGGSDLELAAIADRVLSQGGPALLFENVIG